MEKDRTTEGYKEYQRRMYNIREFENGIIRFNWISPESGKRNWATYPGDEVARREVERSTKRGRLSSSAEMWLGLKGVMACGRRSQVEGRKALGIEQGIKKGSVKEALECVDSYWKPFQSEGEQWYPTDHKTHRVMSFLGECEANKKAYKYAARHQGGFLKFLSEHRPGLYSHISHRREKREQDPKKERENISRELTERYNAGYGISPSSLPSRLLSRIDCLRKRLSELRGRELLLDLKIGEGDNQRKLFEGMSRIELISLLVGIPQRYVRMNDRASMASGKLTEAFTSLLFSWYWLVGEELFGIKTLGEVSSLSGQTCFYHRKRREGSLVRLRKRYFADLRVGNFVVEDKSIPHARFARDRADRIIRNYTHGNPVWRTGEQLRRGIVIFHAPDEKYEKYVKAIEKAGMRVVRYEEFQPELERVIGAMKERGYDKGGEVAAILKRIPLEYLLKAHEEISIHPHLLLARANYYLVDRLNFILKELAKKGAEGREKR